jgi:hypothetical protein
MHLASFSMGTKQPKKKKGKYRFFILVIRVRGEGVRG